MIEDWLRWPHPIAACQFLGQPRVAEPDDNAAGTPQALAAEFLNVLCMRG